MNMRPGFYNVLYYIQKGVRFNAPLAAIYFLYRKIRKQAEAFDLSKHFSVDASYVSQTKALCFKKS